MQQLLMRNSTTVGLLGFGVIVILLVCNLIAPGQGDISVTVVNAKGEPQPGVYLAIEPVRGGGPRTMEGKLTNAQGTFNQRVTAGEYNVVIYPSRPNEQRQHVSIGAGERKEVRFQDQ